MTPFEYFALTFTAFAILALGFIVIYDVIVSTKEEKSM